jgi:hypothetical protein
MAAISDLLKEDSEAKRKVASVVVLIPIGIGRCSTNYGEHHDKKQKGVKTLSILYLMMSRSVVHSEL